MTSTIPLPAGPHPQLLITGAGGFLGRALFAELAKPRDEATFVPSAIEGLDLAWANNPDSPGVHRTTADVRDYEAVRAACAGKDLVIHAASLVDYGHASPKLLEEVNVEGTRNVINACKEAGVRALVYCSTMDVVCGGQAVSGADETLPYPRRFVDAYAQSKAAAEQLILAANTKELRTCAIRPCGMFGEADPYHVSSTIREIQKGKLVARLGSGTALFQHVYVGNVAHAHLLAARTLLEEQAVAAGEVYIITDEPPMNFFDFMAPLMEDLGHKFPARNPYIPYPLAMTAAMAMESVAWACAPLLRVKPTLTRSSVNILCKDMYFRTDKAQRHLGYAPIYSAQEARTRTVNFFRASAAHPLPS